MKTYVCDMNRLDEPNRITQFRFNSDTYLVINSSICMLTFVSYRCSDISCHCWSLYPVFRDDHNWNMQMRIIYQARINFKMLVKWDHILPPLGTRIFSNSFWFVRLPMRSDSNPFGQQPKIVWHSLDACENVSANWWTVWLLVVA